MVKDNKWNLINFIGGQIAARTAEIESLEKLLSTAKAERTNLVHMKESLICGQSVPDSKKFNVSSLREREQFILEFRKFYEDNGFTSTYNAAITLKVKNYIVRRALSSSAIGLGEVSMKSLRCAMIEYMEAKIIAESLKK